MVLIRTGGSMFHTVCSVHLQENAEFRQGWGIYRLAEDSAQRIILMRQGVQDVRLGYRGMK